jgi:hypothetical protein
MQDIPQVGVLTVRKKDNDYNKSTQYLNNLF